MFNNIEVVHEELDSIVAKEAKKLCECKDCWAFLRPNLVGNSVFHSRRNDPFSEGGNDDEPDSAIGDSSWPLLDWLVRLFERDTALVGEPAGTCHD